MRAEFVIDSAASELVVCNPSFLNNIQQVPAINVELANRRRCRPRNEESLTSTLDEK